MSEYGSPAYSSFNIAVQCVPRSHLLEFAASARTFVSSQVTLLLSALSSVGWIATPLSLPDLHLLDLVVVALKSKFGLVVWFRLMLLFEVPSPT